MIESNITPLLKEEIENEVNVLVEEEKTVMTSMNEISNELDSQSNNLIVVKSKFERLEKKMKNLLSKISNIKSYKKLDIPQSRKVSKISDEVSTRYILLNNKFQNKLKLAQQNIQASIDSNANSLVNSPITIKSHKLVMSTNNANIERLKQLQREYQTIESTSRKILEISNDIKRLSNHQNDVVDNISKNVFSIEEAAFKTNEEMERFKESQTNNNKRYQYIAIGLILFILALLLIIYIKYNEEPKK